jgi:hypothetical protein
MRQPLNTSRALVAGFGISLLCAVPALGGSIANLTVTNLSTADLFVDNPVIGLKQERRSSATLLSSSPTAVMPIFSARLAGLAATDTEIAQPSIQTFNDLRMRIDFDIVATPTESWTMQIDQLRNFALTLVDDAGSGFQSKADITLQSATYSLTPGGTGSLTVPVATSEDTGAPFGDVDLPVSESNTNAISGVGATAVSLEFSQFLSAISYANSDPTQTLVSSGQEAAVRFGIAGTLPGVTAEDYPGVGSRVVNDDGHFVNVKLTFVPEPSSAALLLTVGLSTLTRRMRSLS